MFLSHRDAKVQALDPVHQYVRSDSSFLTFLFLFSSNKVQCII